MKRPNKFSIFLSAVQYLICAGLLVSSASMLGKPTKSQETQSYILKSPDQKLRVYLQTSKEGNLNYRLLFKGKGIVQNSLLGLKVKNAPQFHPPFAISTIVEPYQFNEDWTLPWGQHQTIKNHFNETVLKVNNFSKDSPFFLVHIRLYNEGLAFRYEIPKQNGFEGDFSIVEELTEFNFAKDAKAIWQPNDYDTYEHIHQHTLLSEIYDTNAVSEHTHSNPQLDKKGVNTPITMQRKDGLMIMVHEASLVDYPGMTLLASKNEPLKLSADLVPWDDGDKVKAYEKALSPWRVVMVSKKESDLIDSNMILNLNEPEAPISTRKRPLPKPINYIGIFWSLHLGLETWQFEGGRHGATTEKALKTIDFAKENHIKGVLIEGWNAGWESWYGDDNFDFTTPYQDFDLVRVAEYAKANGIEIIGHHETGGQVETYEKRLDKAFALYEKLGIRYVKTGYAGKIRPHNHFHHGQWMVRHYQKVVETAAKYGIALIVHEPIKPTGLRRTYPNLFSAEGVRGMEWNAWSKGNPPRHHLDLVFTRNVIGPMDYTPGVFELNLEKDGANRVLWNELGGSEQRGKVHTTIAKQLAMYAVFYSPVQMIVDLPKNLKGHPGLEMAASAPTDWEWSKTLDAKWNEYVVSARKAKNRDQWFVGGLTGWLEKQIEVDLSFLPKNSKFKIDYFIDGKDADFEKKPASYSKFSKVHRSGDKLVIRVARSGGFLLRISKI